jgi:hypothetical protein
VLSLSGHKADEVCLENPETLVADCMNNLVEVSLHGIRFGPPRRPKWQPSGVAADLVLTFPLGEGAH